MSLKTGIQISLCTYHFLQTFYKYNKQAENNLDNIDINIIIKPKLKIKENNLYDQSNNSTDRKGDTKLTTNK